MIPKELWKYEIFRIGEISFMEFYIVVAIILYVSITCWLLAIVKRRIKLMLLGFMIYPAILMAFAGISGWLGFWTDAGEMLILAVCGVVEGCVFTWIYVKVHKIVNKIGGCEE